MRIIAGLGNPGSRYENNRHNVGFMAADAIARRHSFSPWSRKFKALIAEALIDGEKVLLVKPQTFMNLSGQSVGELMRFHKLGAEDLIVFYDEIDLAPGKVRVKIGGGSGGHNGIKSLDAHCGKNYRRVRIGVGHPGVKELVEAHVLGDFARDDRAWLEPLLDAMADALPVLVKGDDNGFMNKAALALKGNAGGASRTGTAPVGDERPSPEGPRGTKSPKGQSHIRQARPKQPQVTLPQGGPMAAMLRKLLGGS